MKNKLRRTFRGIFKITLVVLLMASATLVGGALWSIISKPTEPEHVDVINENRQTFSYSVNHYTLFDLEQFDFRFMLADIRIESNKPINLSLSSFKTSENLQLNSVTSYLDAIEEAGYNFENYPIVSDLMSSSTRIDALLFIPIVDDALETIDVNITLYPVETLSFDLNNPTNVGIIENLARNEPVHEEGELAAITFVRDTMIGPEQFYHMDESGVKINSSFTSQSQILGVKLTVKNLGSSELKMTKAFAVTKTGEFYIAVDSSYLIDGIDNLAEQSIETEMTGYLFFEALGRNLTTEDFASVNVYFQDASEETMIEIKLEEAQ